MRGQVGDMGRSFIRSLKLSDQPVREEVSWKISWKNAAAGFRNGFGRSILVSIDFKVPPVPANSKVSNGRTCFKT
jgi:hypothetical protein